MTWGYSPAFRPSAKAVTPPSVCDCCEPDAQLDLPEVGDDCTLARFAVPLNCKEGFGMTRMDFERPLGPVRLIGILAILSALVVFAFQAVPALEVDPAIAAPLTAYVAATLAMVAFVVVRIGASGASLAPSGLPFLYVALALLLSTLAGAAGGFGETFLPPTLITPRLILIELVFVFGLWVSLVTLAPERRIDSRVRNRPRAAVGPSPSARHLAVLLLAVWAAFRIYTLMSRGAWSWNQVRGADQGLDNTIEILATLTPAVALMLLLTDHTPRRFIIGPLAATLFVLASVAGLLLGSRDDVIAPVIILLWAYHYRIQPIRPSVMIGVMVAGFLVMALIGTARSSGTATPDGARLLRSIASPTNTTALVAREVPGRSPYLEGDTYSDSLLNATGLRTEVAYSDLSAALRFPRLIGYSGRSGLGFSAPAEAYWNFGLLGALGMPAIFGAIVAVAYRHSRAWPTSPIHLIYPLLLSRIPVGFRSDFLQQSKAVGLIVLAVGVTWAVSRLMQQERGRRVRTGGDERTPAGHSPW